MLKCVLPPLVWACTIPTPTSNPHQSYQDVYLCNKIMYSVIQLTVDNNVPYYFRLEEKMKAKRAEKEEKEKKV